MQADIYRYLAEHTQKYTEDELKNVKIDRPINLKNMLPKKYLKEKKVNENEDDHIAIKEKIKDPLK